MADGRRPSLRFGLALVAGVVVGFILLAAARDLVRIKSSLDGGANSLKGLGLDTASAPGGLARVGDDAAAQLDDAARVADDSPWLGMLGHLPVLGDQVAGLREMSEAAATLGHEGRTTAAAIEQGLKAAGGRPAERVALLDTTLAAVDRLSALVHELHPAASRSLLPPLSSARTSLQSKLAEASTKLYDARTSVTALRRLLAGPSRVLVMAANNAEMTAGSGMPASGGVASIADGDISLGPFV